MNITTWQMYWLTILDSISIGLIVVGIALIIVGLFFAQETDGWSSIAAIAGILLFIIDCFIPSTKQMAAILIIPKIVNNAKVQEIPDKLLSLAEAWMEELKPSKENGK